MAGQNGPVSAQQAIEMVERIPGWKARTVTDAGGGRGVFSTVWRVELFMAPGGQPVTEPPATVIVKLPIEGPNGEAARASGAYEREAWAYAELLQSDEPPPHPRCHRIERDGNRGASFVLEDLGDARLGDQAAGLAATDAVEVVRALAGLHARFGAPGRAGQLAALPVRTSAPAVFHRDGLLAGLAALERRGDQRWLPVFRSVVERRDRLVDAFGSAAHPTLCHGDPRGDNVAFREGGEAVLFDWQQLAVQLGEADLAWLCGTSLLPDTRREVESDLLETYADSSRRSVEETFARYRLGYVLPGLAVLLLAQRATPDAATEAMVARSIERIGSALSDLDLPSLA